MTLYEFLNIVSCMQKIQVCPIYSDHYLFCGYVSDFLLKKDSDRYVDFCDCLVRQVFSDGDILHIVLS